MKDFITDYIFPFFQFLGLHFYRIFRKIVDYSDDVSLPHLLEDFFSVFSNVWVLFVLNISILIVFIYMPQGKDVILIVAESIGVEHAYGNFIWLLVGIVLWSITSEFACRYSIYVSDNSGKSLPDDRVAWRKAVQKLMSDLSLMAPYFIILIALGINYLNDNSLTPSERKWGFGIPAAVIYIALNLISIFYLSDSEDKKAEAHADDAPNKRNIKIRFGKPRIAKSGFLKEFPVEVEEKNLPPKEDKFTILNRKISKALPAFIKDRQLSADEKKWCGKLYGIYNDYTFNIRKQENFQKYTIANEAQGEICSLFNKTTGDNQPENEGAVVKKEDIKTFPQNEEYFTATSIVPKAFTIKEFTTDEGSDDGLYRWVYSIPNSFYRNLHRQIAVIVSICIVSFIIIAMMGIKKYEAWGTPALLMFAIAGWTGIYLGVMYVDNACLRSSPKRSKNMNKLLGAIPFTFIIVFIFLFKGNGYDDHPVRYNHACVSCDNRPLLKQHFKSWIATYTHDTVNCYYSKDTTYCYPVFFICAEGGALRTGAYAALVLSYLQDSFAKKGIDFKSSIYAFSGVSGGCLGLSFFNALAYLNTPNEIKTASYRTATKNFFAKDFLAPVIGDWFYGDVLNAFLPFKIDHFDRAKALEQSWEIGYQEVVNSGAIPYFSQDFLNIYNKPNNYPALFINTTEVESGLQCWVSSVKADTTMRFWKERDLLQYKIQGGINYSTAIDFSTRFPFVSPAGMIEYNPEHKLHYVDGGYVENTGSATMLEILKDIKPEIDTMNAHLQQDTLKLHIRRKIVPYVLVLKFSNTDSASFENIPYPNVATEVLFGLINPRDGRTHTAVEDLRDYTKDPAILGGEMYSISLAKNTTDVPMSWVFSQKSLDTLDSFVGSQCNNFILPKLSILNAAKRLKRSYYIDTTKKSKNIK